MILIALRQRCGRAWQLFVQQGSWLWMEPCGPIICFTLIASGPNGAYPHHHSGERRLQKGDAIIIDIGASLHGYKSDITRMVYLGDPSPEFLRAYAAVYEANQRAVAG